MVVDDAALQRSAYDILVIRDYAIQSGKQVPDDLLDRIAQLSQLAPGERDSHLVRIMRELAALVSPTPLSRILANKRSEADGTRRALIRAGIAAVVVLATVTVAGMYVRRELLGTAACDNSPCDTIFSLLVLGYGASLGLIGSIAYELFHSSGIVRSDDYGTFDDYRSDARFVLGITLGWIFSITVSLQALSRIFSIDTSGDTAYAPGIADYAIILLPFLLGYSSELVTTVLDRLIDSVRILFGMPSKSGTTTVTVTETTPPPTPPPTGKMEISEGPSTDLLAAPMQRFLRGR